MFHSRQVSRILVVIVLLFAGAAVFLAIRISERQEILSQVSRYNLVWLVTQTTNEIARFGSEVGAYLADPSPASREAVRERYEVLASRSPQVHSGDMKAYASADPNRVALLEDLDEGIKEIDALLENIDAPGNAKRILDIIGDLNPRFVRFASSANNTTSERVETERQELLSLHSWFTTLAAALVAGGLALMFVLRIQFRILDQGHARLSLQNERFNAALNNMSQGLCMFDAGQRLIVSNRRMAEVLKIPEDVLARGTSLNEIVAGAKESGVDLSILDRGPAITDGRGFAASLQQTPDGRTIAIAYQLVTDGGWVATYEDVTERKQHEERVAYLANHDTLTGLPNRARFQHDLDEALAESAITGRRVALLCLDLDRFKAINDTLGHYIGDLLLQEVAQRIMSVLRHGDTVARLGGDEFSIIMRNMRTREDAADLAQRVIEAVRAPYDLDGHRVIVETSAGIAVCPDDSTDGEQLFKQADVGLYRTKNDGRGSYRFFEIGMDKHIQARLTLESDLRNALDANQFELHFQPIVSLVSTDEVRCYEALLRWHHPVRGMIPPSDFIPIAEEIGLIVPLGEWIIQEACRQAVTWHGTAHIAVNLSPIQFKRGDVIATVRHALARTGLAPIQLELEITESVLMDDGGRTREILAGLREIGVRIAMDDFGTGYSSLSYLRKFEFDKIKIDRSFVKDIHVQQNRDIINAIVELGRSLGMTVTAEGIETEEQLELLRSAGCHEGQGYLFSRPRRASEFNGLLSDPKESPRDVQFPLPVHIP